MTTIFVDLIFNEVRDMGVAKRRRPSMFAVTTAIGAAMSRGRYGSVSWVKWGRRRCRRVWDNKCRLTGGNGGAVVGGRGSGNCG